MLVLYQKVTALSLVKCTDVYERSVVFSGVHLIDSLSGYPSEA